MNVAAVEMCAIAGSLEQEPLDAVMPPSDDACVRTTLTLDPNAFQAAKAKAVREGISLGKAVSELILQGLRQTPETRLSSAVFCSEGGLYTAAQVEAVLEDE